MKKSKFMILLLLSLFLISSVSASLPKKAKGGIEFSYENPSAEAVFLVGEFNNWEHGNSDKAMALTKNEDGLWWIVVPLRPGRYKYKFVIDDTKWEKNPSGEDANDADNNSLIVVE